MDVDAAPVTLPTESTADAISPPSLTDASSAPALIDIDSQPSRSFVPDLAPVRATEKKSLDFRGKLYLGEPTSQGLFPGTHSPIRSVSQAPLTTCGNLPFRRLVGDYGNDIRCVFLLELPEGFRLELAGFFPASRSTR